MAEVEQKAKVGVDHGALMPTDFEGMYRVAQMFAKSSIVPKPYQNKPEDILVAWEYGAELGLGKMQSLQSIAVINGRPTLPGETLLAIAYSSGELEDYEEVWDGAKKIATCTAKRKHRKPVTRTFSWADAERIKVYEHGQQVTLASRDTYKNYPDRMCTMRARGFALRDAFADRIKGLKTSEEMEEVPPDEEKAFNAAKPIIPDLEKKPEPTRQAEPDGNESPEGLHQAGPGGSESAGPNPEPVQEQAAAEQPAEQPKPESKALDTVDKILAAVNTMSVERWDEQELYLLGKNVFGKLSNAEEKLAVTMAVNRKRRELFPR